LKNPGDYGTSSDETERDMRNFTPTSREKKLTPDIYFARVQQEKKGTGLQQVTGKKGDDRKKGEFEGVQ